MTSASARLVAGVCLLVVLGLGPGARADWIIPERIPDKVARNECGLFSLRVTLERDTPSGSMRPEDARRAFDSLFRQDRP